MPSKYVHTEIEGQKIRLSNLDKIIYPNAHITKAEVIKYYIDVAEYYLKYNRNRPTTLIRYPDGINSDSFYSKSAPDWTPEWIRKVNIQHSKKIISYIVLQNKIDLAWTANLSGLELHPAQMNYSRLDNPEYFIFDLDPDIEQNFNQMKDIAFLLRAFLESYGYSSFVKTSGSKGLHIMVPIISNCSHNQLTKALKKITQEFIDQNPDTCTLHLKKDKRQGKLLIDIFRNHKTQTTVAPYSLRAKPLAPISMPLTWEELKEINSSQEYNITNYKVLLKNRSDPWELWEESKVELHELRQPITKKEKANLDTRLIAYNKKRDFYKTDEPAPTLDRNAKSEYVVQLHDARNLHYDLRLEHEDVLLSWAIPHGLPFYENEKRLAIRTEDHPVKYLYYEGVIPKNQYGAGKMWILNGGDYEILKFSKKSIKFNIKKGIFKAIYKIYKINASDHWLIERFTNHRLAENKPTKHMLASTTKDLQLSINTTYEIKWDGIRVFLIKDDNDIKIYSRSGRDISQNFPEIITIAGARIKSNKAIIDGELVCLDNIGRPKFSKIISRMHTKGINNIERSSKLNPSVLYAFDLIEIDNIDLCDFPLFKRQDILASIVKISDKIRLSEIFKDGKALLEAAKMMDLEGIMIKNINGKYHKGLRSENWLKYKFRFTEKCIIVGYTKGKGERANLFGSLHLISTDNTIYRGRVGSGFDDNKMSELLRIMKPLEVKKKPIADKVEEASNTTWLKPKLVCKIQYATLTENGTFREPIFLNLNQE